MNISPYLTSLLPANTNVQELIKKLNFQGVCNSASLNTIYLIPPQRASNYKDYLKLPQNAVLVGMTNALESSPTEYIAQLTIDGDNTSLHLHLTNCKIMYTTISPSELVEFTYDGKTWACSNVAHESLEYYRDTKFEYWKNLLLNPTCKAQFKRMLQLGLVNRIFDHMVFPMGEEEQSRWQVTDDNGKTVNVPRAVKGLRLFSPSKNTYIEIETLMKNAPSDEEASRWWKNFVDELKMKHGEKFISSILDN